ncbi:MAG: hypothetical protein NC343_04900 [Muribaculum sp.]|nr:hypothetical protein [Muribaculaceae bacterium]MCM1081070.1 hypothetical protein [Muribaculum sp.]
MNGQWPFCEKDEFWYELKQAAWNILHENPGTECGDWITMLIEQFPMEVVDALGSDPFDVNAQLCDLWDCNDYEDEVTGECHSFATWAEYFATDRSVELYDMYAEAKAKISRLEASQNKRR